MAKTFSGTGIVSGLSTDRTSMTSPATGMQFYETDTDRTYLYDSANWIWQSGNALTNAQTASYVLVLSDKNKIIEISNASANNLTVPLNSSVPFPVGSQITIIQTGAGQTTIVATGGVTINARIGLKLSGQWSAATLLKRATDAWVLMGDTTA
jgi:hypothetical protein